VPSLAVHTLGCKLNQLETESVALAFAEAGFSLVPWEAGADILLVNTCTVTSRAEQKARRIIRKALREHPAALVIVTGCYAQLDAEEIAALDEGGEGRLLVVKGELKAALLDLPRAFTAGEGNPDTGNAGAALARWERARREQSPAGGPFSFNPQSLVFHSRPSLKIQDGCDHRCAYCRVSLARGPSVSLDAARVLARLQALEAGGVGEAILTGVNISLYRDGSVPAPGGMGLGGLLRFLLENTRSISLRLSSLEPGAGLGPEFFAILGHPRIRPHFHLSLQSGSAAVLERMGRRYGPPEIAALIARLRAEKGDPFLACDMITGFPGETPGDFETTCALCEETGFAGIHAFPYSRRPGSPAWGFKPAVPESTAVLRVERLTALARRGREAYAARWLGRVVEAVPELTRNGRRGVPAGFVAAVTENYLKVLVSGAGAPPGASFKCRLLPLPANCADARAAARYDTGGERVE
jgi:threonylcarbamoyladenosine tRNA methylthiotransferase MtaB